MRAKLVGQTVTDPYGMTIAEAFNLLGQDINTRFDELQTQTKQAFSRLARSTGQYLKATNRAKPNNTVQDHGH